MSRLLRLVDAREARKHVDEAVGGLGYQLVEYAGGDEVVVDLTKLAATEELPESESRQRLRCHYSPVLVHLVTNNPPSTVTLEAIRRFDAGIPVIVTAERPSLRMISDCRLYGAYALLEVGPQFPLRLRECLWSIELRLNQFLASISHARQAASVALE